MVTFTHKRIEALFSSLSSRRIAIIGDVMIDRYVWGAVSRISPEAPVPVVEVDNETERLGGAANVATNIKSLGCDPLLIGVVGDDHNGKSLRAALEDLRCSSSGIVTDPDRPTTVKTRVIAHNQHVVRIDSEEKRDVPAAIQDTMVSLLERQIDSIDGIIIEDYNKGVVVKELISHVIDVARRHGKIITVDPKFNNFFNYIGVTVFKPNKKEVEEALGIRLRDDDDYAKAGKILAERLKAENILFTRSEKGISLYERNGALTHMPTKARKIADVSGAGDTVIATLTAMMSNGATIKEAASIANFAGGIVCGEVGIVPINPKELASTIVTDTVS